jgi:hypothetical protein
MTNTNKPSTALTPDLTGIKTNITTQANYVTSDPVDNTGRILVRSTVTGFEQGIAATAGFFTAGPLGALASWATIRGCQGKWTPWFVLGLPAVVVINVLNIAVIGALMTSGDQTYPNQEQSSLTSSTQLKA